MSSDFGKNIHVSVFGQSHGKAIGVMIDGLPSGERIDEDELYAFMQRRRPGKNKMSTARSEADKPIFLSGVMDGKTCAFPLCAIIENTDTRSKDYANLRDIPRPSHADFTAYKKWGSDADMRGGGHFSGRLTAPLCIAGGIAKQILARRGIYVGAHLLSVGHECEDKFPLYPTKEMFEAIGAKEFPVIDDNAGERMKSVITQASERLDSVGGIIECAVIGVPSGLGNPMFDGIENRLANAIFGIPAVKGLEFGSGFEGAMSFGSENNDPFIMKDGEIACEKNDAGGALGGISTGMPIVFKTAMKPTPSIAMKQKSVSLSAGENCELEIKGRHDPCIAHRAVPVVEAVAAIVILDFLMEDK